MSTLTRASELPMRARTRRLTSFVTTGVVLALCVAEFINLSGRHTVGAESYGVLVAGVAVAAGIFSLGLLLSPQRRAIATAAVLLLWAIVVLGGIAGTYYHIVGVAPEYGPVDPRPRPIAAPLVFTLLGIVEGTALYFAQRVAGVRRALNREEE
jgi:hypothetical protein